ncbi:MAG: hypothetical protein GTO03_02210 [Planctomycetales bacterium]|nr:hypothetical protein [Planctomycetales bacterium]
MGLIVVQLLLGGDRLAAAGSGSGDERAGDERPGDELWLVDCRALTTVRAATQKVDHRLRAWRYDRAQATWQRQEQAQFLEATGRVMPTCFWVHGDRVDPDKSFHIGREVYHQLVADRPAGPPIRFVVWSWPTTKQMHGRPLKDARIKAARADAAGYSLAWVLSACDPDTPVSLLGFSFGARVVAGAVHLAAGGQLDGYAIAADRQPAGAYQVVLLAAAMDDQWLLPGKKHGQALQGIRQLLLVNNGQDWVLKRYHLLKCGNGCQALGYQGLIWPASLPDHEVTVSQMNAGPYIGKQHRWGPYVYTKPVITKVRQTILSPPAPPLAQPPEKQLRGATRDPARDPARDQIATTGAADERP